MTPDLLARVGRCLHGEHWQVPLSKDLRVNDRTVRGWKSGRSPVPSGIAAELIALLTQRRVDISAVLPELRKMTHKRR